MKKYFVLLCCICLFLSGCRNEAAGAAVPPVYEETVMPLPVQTGRPEETFFYSDEQKAIAENIFLLYTQREPAENNASFEGAWRRTNVHSGNIGNLEISEQGADGFAFQGQFYYYGHSGFLEGEAFFIAPGVACYAQTPEKIMQNEYVLFFLQDEMLRLVASGKIDGGFGAGVSADGEYTREQPQYTNDTPEDYFTEEELKSIKSLIGEEAYLESFVYCITRGRIEKSLCLLEEARLAVCYRGTIPTLHGDGFTFIYDGDKMYFTFEDTRFSYISNDSSAAEFPIYLFV